MAVGLPTVVKVEPGGAFYRDNYPENLTRRPCELEGSPLLNDFGKLKIRANLGEGAFMTRKVLRPTALFGMVAAMLTVTIVLTLSHSTVSMSGVGVLKCYGTGGIQKAC
jgi:hypothetical protein